VCGTEKGGRGRARPPHLVPPVSHSGPDNPSSLSTPTALQRTVNPNPNPARRKGFIRLLPPLDTLSRPPVMLPPRVPPANGAKLTLVLDLDETLVHSSTVS